MTLVHQARPPREARIFDDVLPADLPRPELTDNARLVLERRYLKKDATGKPTEKPEVMFWRVARTIADVDRDYGASPSAVEEVARMAWVANDRMENIGARRLHTVMATLMDDLLFDLPRAGLQQVTMDAAKVRERLAAVLEDDDLRKYIL